MECVHLDRDNSAANMRIKVRVATKLYTRAVKKRPSRGLPRVSETLRGFVDTSIVYTPLCRLPWCPCWPCSWPPPPQPPSWTVELPGWLDWALPASSPPPPSSPPWRWVEQQGWDSLFRQVCRTNNSFLVL